MQSNLRRQGRNGAGGILRARHEDLPNGLASEQHNASRPNIDCHYYIGGLALIGYLLYLLAGINRRDPK
jgi:hypothetical protein